MPATPWFYHRKMKLQRWFWHKIAFKAPKPLVYWCAIRLGANATQGEWSNVPQPELKFMDALKRWETCR